jgi:hypothetical protein
VKVIVLFLSLILSAAAQQPSSSQASAPPAPSPKIPTADCTLVDDSPGCRSFNEMLVSQDKDLTSAFDGSYIVYACFERGADIFRIISISSPNPLLYEKEKSTPIESQKSVAFYQQFKNGVSSDFQIIGGTWKHSPGFSEFFNSAPGDQTISVNDAEVAYTDTYENLRKTKTTYTLTIRRSTLRFAQNYRYPSEDNKAVENVDETGRCLHY